MESLFLKPRKRKSFLQTLILLLAVFVTLILVLKPQKFFGGAEGAKQPKETVVSNTTDRSISVTWLTDVQTEGYVSYGNTQDLGFVAKDDRDSDSSQRRYTHHVTVKGLNPQQLYYFKIGSDDLQYDNQGKLYEIKTAPVTGSTPSVSELVYGNIVANNVDDSLVYVDISGGTALSSYPDQQGKWIVVLNNARRYDLQNYIRPQKEDKVVVTAKTGSGTARLETTVAKSSPVSDIKIAEDNTSNRQELKERKIFDFKGFRLFEALRKIWEK